MMMLVFFHDDSHLFIHDNGRQFVNEDSRLFVNENDRPFAHDIIVYLSMIWTHCSILFNSVKGKGEFIIGLLVPNFRIKLLTGTK